MQTIYNVDELEQHTSTVINTIGSASDVTLRCQILNQKYSANMCFSLGVNNLPLRRKASVRC